jgi:hypothetical protein
MIIVKELSIFLYLFILVYSISLTGSVGTALTDLTYPVSTNTVPKSLCTLYRVPRTGPQALPLPALEFRHQIDVP